MEPSSFEFPEGQSGASAGAGFPIVDWGHLVSTNCCGVVLSLEYIGKSIVLSTRLLAGRFIRVSKSMHSKSLL